MENIYAMLARVDFLDEIRAEKRRAAAKVLQEATNKFVAHYGHVKETEVEVENLSIEEMEALHQFMVDTINHDLQYLEDEINRYQNICL